MQPRGTIGARSASGGSSATAAPSTGASPASPFRRGFGTLGPARPVAQGAAKADVARAGVRHLRPPRGRPVAQAVAVGAGEGPALDHLAGDRELGLGPVVAPLEGASARVARHAARLVGLLRMTVGVPVGRPLPDVAGRVVEAEAVG